MSSSNSSSSLSNSSSSSSSCSSSSSSSLDRYYDPQLIEAIKDELRLKLTCCIDEQDKGIITIWLSRSSQYVCAYFNNDTMTLKHSPLPDNDRVESQCFNLSDPYVDPIKAICRFVDKALRLIASYENKVKISKSLLGRLL